LYLVETYIHVLTLIQIEEEVIIAFLTHKYRGSFGNYCELAAGAGALATNVLSN